MEGKKKGCQGESPTYLIGRLVVESSDITFKSNNSTNESGFLG